jgi:phosphatidylglycerophosphate synthase
VRVLASLGVSPNLVSLLGPALGLIFVWSVRHNLRLSFVVWILSLMVDGLDGALARYSGRVSASGAVVDQFADHTRETLIVVGLAASGALSPLWGSLYPFVYCALNVSLFLGNYYGVPAPLAIKSWIVLYPAIVLYLLFGRNLLDVAAAASIALMTLAIIPGLGRLSRGMEQGTR